MTTEAEHGSRCWEGRLQGGGFGDGRGVGAWRRGADDLGTCVQPWDAGVRLTEKKQGGGSDRDQ